MTEELPHDDVLMSAILDEPLPPGRSADPATAAAHRAAVADLTALRAGLRLLGDTLARDPSPDPASDPSGAADSPGTAPDPSPDPEAAPVPAAPRAPRPAPRRPPGRRDGRRIARRFAVGVSALTCAAALAAGVSWLNETGGLGTSSESAKEVGEPAMQPLPSDADRKGDGSGSLSPEGFVACSRLIFEGTVARVEPVPGAPRDRITLDVERHYKPDKGPGRITLTMDRDIDPRLTPGQRTLISVPKGEDHPDNWATGGDMAELRELVVGALPGAKATGCDGAGPRG
ncbi:hypothetical protein GT204_29585 [Streptomyces sp. SID4919]|uniref:hypothetical protein n=1 Tax=unclassified Streptomyces TaxID=2593676 RepID=UPI0008239999|nr:MULTISPECIES: hypothetical protein [unclassified Streptomyces]MYY12930.1 hypothetical protein [Streptomyces sp. SID4919]SCK22331.1 hypothetical protein YW7DRAFT_01658 [Streptomyces sp. AmelKG-E11A]